MPTSTTAARLRYLDDSAHLLTYSAPSTAAFLQSRYNHVVAEEEVSVPDSRSREICNACGFNMLWNTTCLPVPSKTESRKERPWHGDSSSVGKGSKTALLSCRKCFGETHHTLPAAKRARASSTLRTKATSATMDPAPIVYQTGSQASSGGVRKRAKGRKHNSLQAMLAKSKAETAATKAGFGLDLMDLMTGA